MRSLALLVVAACALACAGRPPDIDPPAEGEGEGEGEPDTRALPTYFRLLAEAEVDSGEFVTACALDWHFEMRSETTRDDDVLEMAGVHGGEASRSFLDDTGAGVFFRADVFGETNVRWTRNPEGDDGFTIEIPINATGIERFWLNLITLEGTVSEDGQRASGTWTCAPMDIEQGGIVDDTVFVDGTWTTAPEDVEPK